MRVSTCEKEYKFSQHFSVPSFLLYFSPYFRAVCAIFTQAYMFILLIVSNNTLLAHWFTFPYCILAS